MKNDNIIDFSVYYKPATEAKPHHNPSTEHELIIAIQNLIQRLRENAPLKQTG